MTFLRILSTIGLSISLAIIIWLVISGALYVLLDNWEGWPPLSPGEPSQHVQAALIIGALNGFLVSLCLIFMLHRGSFWWALGASIVATEVGLLIALVLLFAFVDNGWKPPTFADAILIPIVYFLIFSAVLVIPTLLIAFVVGHVVNPAR